MAVVAAAVVSSVVATAHAGKTPVTAAVVYPDRALVTRSASVACGPQAIATFTGIPPVADRTSFRGGTSVGTVEGVRFEERAREEAFSTEAHAVELDIERVMRETREVRDALEQEQTASQLAGRYADTTLVYVGREMVEARPQVPAWRAALQGTLDAQMQSSVTMATHEARLRDLQRKLVDLNRKLAALRAGRGRREIVAEVVVACPAGKTAKVDVSYMVGGAGWGAAYEARLSARGEVSVATYATVRQATGEDWKNARLTLSTAVPRQDATPPEIRPLRLWADERKPPKKVLVSRQESRKHAQSGGDSAGAGDQRVAMADQGLSVQLVVPDASDVPGDGTAARLLVAHTTMRGRVHLRATPAILPYVFRVAELTNGAPFPLLPGPVDAFNNNAFIGRTQVGHVGRGARFDLTFGIDDGLKVERTTLREAKEEMGLLGGSIQYRYGYVLDLTNSARRAAEIEIHESVPVSELDDVKVAIEGKTTGGYQHRKDDGLVVWRLKLKPAETRQLQLEFRVDAPSTYRQ